MHPLHTLTASLPLWAALALLIGAGSAQAAPACTGYRESVAVVIGINTYTGTIAPLSSARQDAERVAAALTARGFEVTALYDGDATRAAIMETLDEVTAASMAPCSRLLVFFAGHGETTGRSKKTGFLLPVDADGKRVASTGVAMGEVSRFLARSEARHKMLLADACYAGYAVVESRAIRRLDAPANTEAFGREALKGEVTAVIVAGQEYQPAYSRADQGGFFTQAVLEAIDGKADTTAPRGVLTEDELWLYVKQRVPLLAKKAHRGLEQNPKAAIMGEGAFFLMAGDALPTPTNPDPLGVGVLFRGRGASPLWPWVWTAAGVSAAALTAGVLLNAGLDGARDDYDRADRWADARDALDAGDAFGTWRNVSYVVSGVAAAAAVGLVIGAVMGERAPPVTAWVAPTGGGLGFAF